MRLLVVAVGRAVKSCQSEDHSYLRIADISHGDEEFEWRSLSHLSLALLNLLADALLSGLAMATKTVSGSPTKVPSQDQTHVVKPKSFL